MIRAVIVDDEPDVRELTRLFLELDEAAEIVGEAANGIAGLSLIERVHPDVAVIDLSMPGIDGVSLIRQLRSAHAPVRLVAYSADDQRLGDALDAGADAAVVKTGASDDLLRAIVPRRSLNQIG